jgi:hypothetical protein
MGEISGNKKGIEELLEKIPVERCWAITAKTLWRFTVLRGDKITASILGKGEGIIAPVMGAEKWIEINEKLYKDGGKVLFPWVKETFNIPVENAIDADDLVEVVCVLAIDPESGSESGEYVEKSPERVVWRINRCLTWERYNEFEVDSEHRAGCHGVCQIWMEEGLKAVNPKIAFKLTKARSIGDPYCGYVIEFKDE